MPAGVRFSGLDQWLAWQQALHPATIELGLERAAQVLGRTGWRPPACPVLTVGGTNGKGSCVALLASMLRAGGYRVASFTSPHLIDYRERICVDDQPASDASLVAAFERIADSLDSASLTFFEFNTLAALLIFETARPDAIVLEVGMGGRLDAVNLVDADVAVVTSVALDHVEWLGRDVESIGREKAGIFRPHRPAIVGTRSPPESLIDTAVALGAELRRMGHEFDAVAIGDGRWDYRDKDGELSGLPAPAIQGAAQIDNAATALAALRALSARLPVLRAAVEQGLRSVSLPGRFQRLPSAQGFEWLLDVAHNPESARLLRTSLARHPPRGRTLAVCGMLTDKDVEGVLDALKGAVDEWIATRTDGERAMSDEILLGRAAARGIPMLRGGAVADALALAASLAREGDRIVVFGSFHTVGPALRYLRSAGTTGERTAACV
jgi:dihydrofolate synthase/folylpolyglutamate synthase